MHYRKSFRSVHPFTRMLLLVLFMFVLFVVVLGVGLLVAIPLLGDDVMALMRGQAMDGENINLLRYFQVLSHLGLFVVPSIVFALVISRRPVRYLEAHRLPALWPSALSVLIVFAAVPMVSYLLQVNQGISLPDSLRSIEEWMRSTEDAAEKLTRRFLEVYTWREFAINMLMIAVIPAIGEEFIFRGIIQKLFTEWTRNKHVAIVITAILFSAMHLQFFGFLPRVWLGIVLGYLLVYSGNIWFPVLAHFINNTAALIFYHFHSLGKIDIEIEDLGAGPMGAMLAVSSLVVIIALFVAFRRAVSRKIDRK